MLRLINVQQQYVEGQIINYPSGETVSHRGLIVTCDVADIEKQQTLGTIKFMGEHAQTLASAKENELTRLTTITGYAEQVLRNYYAQ